MPMGALERQALGISLLKAQLVKNGIVCDVRYLTFAFAELIGYEEYQWMSFDLPYTAFAGDWSFTHALYGENYGNDNGYIQEILRKTWQLDDSAINRILHVRSRVPYFLEHCMTSITWEDYAIVGFTSTFEQNIASLALAKMIKSSYPEISIVFGGANWEGEMGYQLHKQFSFVDYVCSGEADQSFPALVQLILANEALNKIGTTIRGVVYRSGSDSVYTGPSELIRDMDILPFPDFNDYFHDLSLSTVAASVVPILLFEGSRGCWWGAKSHCTFCGLNGSNMTFRSKSSQRALDELDFLVKQWQIELVEVVDNILDMRYFNNLLPALANIRQPMQLFYEVKANLTRKHVEMLSRAGINRIQPGIESLSDHVLSLMQKGTTALRNIQLLKWCKEFNITAEWNILYGFPGETREDYVAMLDLMRSIRFFNPPTACGPIRLDRFSPYHNSPGEFGISNVRSIASCKYLYPFGEDTLKRITYYFDFDYETSVDPTGYATNVIEYVAAWQHEPETGTLSSITQPDGTLVLVDSRSDASLPHLRLSNLERAAYEYCDEMHSGASVVQQLHTTFPDTEFDEQRVFDFLDSLVANRLMVSDGIYYLSLAIPIPTLQTRSVAAFAVNSEPTTID